MANHPNYYLDYKVTPIYQKDELIPRQIELQYVGIDENGKLLGIKLGGSKEKVDQYSVTHVVLDNVSANAEINYLDGTAKNTVEDAKIKEEKEKAKKEAEEKAKKEAEEKEATEKKAKEEEQEKARQAAQEKEESQDSNSQSTNSGGYFRDKNGRWHRPNGKFASKKEIREAGLQW